MPDLSRYDAEYRPQSYFVTDPETAVLSRIKGAVRRETVRSLGVQDVDPATRAESLEPEDREAVGRMHPSLMGGEYLPDLRKGEVEIARIELDSVTGDVISLRARWASGKIRYKMVDEYEESYKIKPAQSDQPLTFGKLVKLIDGEGTPNNVRDMNFGCECDRQAAERLVGMVRVTSEFYPEISVYYEEDAQEWLARVLRGLG